VSTLCAGSAAVHRRNTVAYSLRCPCGLTITAPDDTFVETVQAHLTAEHPGRDYSENEILAFAMPIPDRPTSDPNTDPAE
jgi:hypothetical protein